MFIDEKTLRRFVEEFAEEILEVKGYWYSDHLYLDNDPSKEQLIFTIPTFKANEHTFGEFYEACKKAAGKEWAIVPMRNILEGHVAQYSIALNEAETLRK